MANLGYLGPTRELLVTRFKALDSCRPRPAQANLAVPAIRDMHVKSLLINALAQLRHRTGSGDPTPPHLAPKGTPISLIPQHIPFVVTMRGAGRFVLVVCWLVTRNPLITQRIRLRLCGCR